MYTLSPLHQNHDNEALASTVFSVLTIITQKEAQKQLRSSLVLQLTQPPCLSPLISLRIVHL